MPKTRRVAFLLRTVPHYRLRFLELLKSRLAAEDIELAVLYGTPGETESLKRDTVELTWGRRVTTRRWGVGSRDLEWHSVLPQVAGVDLVIMTQEAKLLENYVIHAKRRWGGPRIAYWGHGRNFQPKPGAWFPEGVKRFLARRVDWWFAYTALSESILQESGVDRDRITVVNNSIDTRALQARRERIGEAELNGLRSSLRMTSQNVGIFSGGMYREKRLGFLVQACRVIRECLPDFEMIFMGDGPDVGIVRKAALENPWIHYLGPLFGEARVLPFAASKVTLMPGLVGLVVLDSFVHESPLVTAAGSAHSPEIAYLQHDENGLIVEAGEDPGAYARTVCDLLTDPQQMERLRRGCRRAAAAYSAEDMADRFAAGVLSVLDTHEARPAGA